jgi:hypothetical protein
VGAAGGLREGVFSPLAPDGSATPPGLCANFNEGVTPHANYAGHYRLWMARVEVIEEGGK